jgi:hypothetical protein
MAQPVWIRRVVIVFGMLYFVGKLLKSVQRLGPKRFVAFAREAGEYRTWGYEVQIKRKGIALNFTNVARAMIQHPNRIAEIGDKVVAALKANLTPANTVKPEDS